MTRKRRTTVELLGYNNGRLCGSARLEEKGWVCCNYVYPEYEAVVSTMREAERELREEVNATRIIRYPALPETKTTESKQSPPND